MLINQIPFAPYILPVLEVAVISSVMPFRSKFPLTLNSAPMI